MLRPGFGPLSNSATSTSPSACDNSSTKDMPSNMKALPATGDVLAWTGSTVYHPESLQSVLTASDWPGVLQPRRPTQRLLDVLNPETKTVRPGLSLVLEQPLLPVHWFGSQVFVARVMRYLPNADSVPQHGAAEEHRVVLKLMYFDARRHGQNVDLDGFDFVAAPPIVKFAKSEADCYAALEKCQGSLVPYCYGFYKVQLANGHHCIAQVMEYVHGLSPDSFAKSLRIGLDDDKIDAFLTRLFCSLIELHKAGVLHKDQASRNIRLLYPLDPLRPNFVVFDFGYSILAKDFEINKAEWGEKHWLDMDERRIKWFFEECGSDFNKAAKEWQKSPKGARLVRRWKTHPDDLAEGDRVHDWFQPMLQKVRAKL